MDKNFRYISTDTTILETVTNYPKKIFTREEKSVGVKLYF